MKLNLNKLKHTHYNVYIETINNHHISFNYDDLNKAIETINNYLKGNSFDYLSLEEVWDEDNTIIIYTCCYNDETNKYEESYEVEA